MNGFDAFLEALNQKNAEVKKHLCAPQCVVLLPQVGMAFFNFPSGRRAGVLPLVPAQRPMRH